MLLNEHIPRTEFWISLVSKWSKREEKSQRAPALGDQKEKKKERDIAHSQ
jgi:hypothetical protein